MHKFFRVTLVALVALCLHSVGCASSETDTTGGPGPSSSGSGGGGGASCVPEEEACDGVDNDCDMEVDEDCECLSGESQDCYTGPPGTEGVGICTNGTQVCNPATNTFGPCANDVTPASAEACNGLDDDCNGNVDEDFPALQCGVGACLVVTPACVGGMPGTCAPGLPSLEICDGTDNDCDQLVDESYPGQGAACATGMPGVCTDGTMQCLKGAEICVPTLTPLNETCDGIDNDCNGTVDDNVPGTGGGCGTGMPGVCALGSISCQGNVIDCFPVIPPSSEVCDGLDNDCNGQMDEGDPGGGSACDTGLQGVCGAGVLTCTVGSLQCIQLESPGVEACDALDNNCDGQVDEGDPGGGVECTCGGTRACVTGELVCQNAQPGCFFTEDFDDGCPPDGWTLGGDWQCGTPTSGPGAAYSVPYCLATQLAGPYSTSQSYDIAIAEAPPLDLTAATQPTLRFQMWTHTETNYDGVNLKVSTDGGASYTQVTSVSPPYNNNAGGQTAWGTSATTTWQPYTADLSEYVGQTILLRWSFRSDGSVQNTGVYVDDVLIAEAATIPLMITTTSPLPTALAGSAYQVQLQKTGGSAASVWSIVGGTNSAWLSVNPTTGLMTGTPVVANAGPFSVTVRVEEPTIPSNFHEVTLTGQVRQIVSTMGFEGACPDGWALTGDWQCGTPSVVGPSAAFAGTQCIATRIAGNYNNGQTFAGTTASSPAISLAGTTSPQLSFRVWMNTEGSIYDGYNLKISTDGVTYTQVTTVLPAYNLTIAGEQVWGGDQSALGWQVYTANLSAYAGQTVNLRFAFRTDTSVVRPGVYIDEVIVID